MNTFIHLTMVEILKLLLIYVIIPLIVLLAFYLLFAYTRLLSCLNGLKASIVGYYINIRFESILQGTNKKLLRNNYLSNAINNAYSSDKSVKRTAIEQLCQFSEDSALDALIKLLSSEREEVFKYLIIDALHMIMRRRLSMTEDHT